LAIFLGKGTAEELVAVEPSTVEVKGVEVSLVEDAGLQAANKKVLSTMDKYRERTKERLG